MKKCYNCGELKEEIEFHKNPSKKDGFGSTCKDCRKIYHREHYLKNKKTYLEKARKNDLIFIEWLSNIKKTLKCSGCGEERWWVLDFHHKDKSDKIGTISNMVNRGQGGRNTVLEEMKKCEVLCANCHRNLHYKEQHAEVAQ